jgi:hypothetical protein
VGARAPAEYERARERGHYRSFRGARLDLSVSLPTSASWCCWFAAAALSLSYAAPEIVHYGRPFFKAAPEKHPRKAMRRPSGSGSNCERAVVSEQFDPNIPNGPVAAGVEQKCTWRDIWVEKFSHWQSQMRFYYIQTALNLL